MTGYMVTGLKVTGLTVWHGEMARRAYEIGRTCTSLLLLTSETCAVCVSLREADNTFRKRDSLAWSPDPGSQQLRSWPCSGQVSFMLTSVSRDLGAWYVRKVGRQWPPIAGQSDSGS